MIDVKGTLVLDHPLAQEILTELRDKKTDQIRFRKGLVKMGRLMGYELMRTMEAREIGVETPLAKTKGIEIVDKHHILVVTVLRAAMPFVEGFLKAFPEARQGVVSAKRMEMEDARGAGYKFEIRMDYVNVPPIRPETVLIVVDPMLASGSTQEKVIGELLKRGKPKRLIVASVISCPTGIERVKKAFPQAEIVTSAIDPELNQKGYIVPGLGDAGDRAFHSE